jgi:membrane protease YdiL (CAAX protease family)
MFSFIDQGFRAEDHFSQFKPLGSIGRFFNFPLSRILVIVLFLMPLVLLNSVLVMQVIEVLPKPLATQIDAIRMLITGLLLIYSYRFYCKVFEKREVIEIDLHYLGKEFSAGGLLAVVAVCLMVAAIAIWGQFSILFFAHPTVLLTNLINFSVGALLQELILLCIIYRLVEEFAGSWIALLVALPVFSFAHILNPNENLLSVLFLVLSSIVLIAPFILTRRIWLSWGFHALWNFMQAGVFGMPNSGIEFPGWIKATIEGPWWLTGGSVGIEGSPIAVAFDLCIGLILITIAYRKGQFVRPQWKR